MMNEQTLNISSMEPLHICLASTLLQPALRSMLIFDAPFSGLEQIAQQMVMLAAASGQQLTPHVIRSANDDDLWGEYRLPDSQGTIQTQAQVFSPPQHAQATPLLIIPDLSTLNLTAARTCIMLLDSPVAHLERHGQQAAWTPRYYWLAGCRQEDVGSVSPHLLDRFALRLSWQSTGQLAFSHRERVAALQSNLQRSRPESVPPLDPTLIEQIKQAQAKPPSIEVAPALCEEITTYFSDGPIHQRRELALARCSVALAQLAGDTRLLAEHIEQAAELMGLIRQDEQAEPDSPAPDEEPKPAEQMQGREISSSAAPQTRPTIQQPANSRTIEAEMPEPSEQPAIEYARPADDPYPEDTQPVSHEAASLQLPQRHFVGARSDRGPIIGVEPTTTLRDLALVHTLMRAMLFQQLRRPPNSKRIILDWIDLRKYRRAAEPEQLLLVLLDYTCLDLARRQQALIPYLNQAYIDRASITIIQVGAHKEQAKSDLRATLVSARTILVPTISEAIDATAGSATPLAHGLELALQVMQRALQHGRSTVQQITLVVLSDGRGNVPLRASHSNTITRPVAQAGVEDALKLAREIAQVKQVARIVLAPKTRYYRELPVRLASALNAQLVVLEEEDKL
jgi:magnesium chelatase subunit D